MVGEQANTSAFNVEFGQYGTYVYQSAQLVTRVGIVTATTYAYSLAPFCIPFPFSTSTYIQLVLYTSTVKTTLDQC